CRHHDLRFAGIRGADLDARPRTWPHWISRRDDADHVRRLVVISRAAPADAEALRGDDLIAAPQDQTVRTRAQAFFRDAQRLAGADINRGAINGNVASGSTPTPLAAVQIPIVIPFLAHNLPLHAAHGDALAVAIERDHVKANDFALACPPVLERWPQAEIEVVQAHRHREALTHHTPARIGDARDHARAQRPGSFWVFRQTERKLRGAAAIRHRSRQLEVALVKALIGYTEAIAFMFRERVRIDHQPAFRFHREAGTRRPVEEISLHIDRPRLPAAEHIFA